MIRVISFIVLAITVYHGCLVSSSNVPNIEKVINSTKSLLGDNNEALEEPECDLPPKDGRAAIADETYYWPNGVVPYKIDPNFDDELESNIKQAFHDISAHTCVKFKHRKHEEDYIYVLNGGSGCNSPVGMQGGKQFVNLASKPGKVPCAKTLRTVRHELLHALGLHHEMIRPDRDDYVRINFDNIQEHHKHNFVIPKSDQNTFNIPFDPHSIMMYKWNEFAIDKNQPTITLKNGTIDHHLRGDHMSKNDIALVRAMYNCEQKPHNSNQMHNPNSPCKACCGKH